MIAVPPARFEFGLIVRYHVPAVYALPRPIVVCIEEGREALYPDARHIFVERRPDRQRKDVYDKDRIFVRSWVERLRKRYPGCRIETPERYETRRLHRRFIPRPIIQYGASADVIICPRKREVAPERNWAGWSELGSGLRSAGLRVFAAGARATSDLSVQADDYAWEYERDVDATIEAMLSAKLVVATDAGLAHLAILCGRPLLLILHGKLSGPGVRRMSRVHEYYEVANHQNAPILVEGAGWFDARVVLQRALSFLQPRVGNAPRD